MIISLLPLSTWVFPIGVNIIVDNRQTFLIMVISCVNLGNVLLAAHLLVFSVVAGGCTAVTAIIPVYNAAATDSDIVVDGATKKGEGRSAVAAE